MALLKTFAIVATAMIMLSSAKAADPLGLDALGEKIRVALLNAVGAPESGIPINVTYDKTIGGPDGLSTALNLTGTLHGPNGTMVTEKDTTTLGGSDHYKREHDAKSTVSTDELLLGGGKNTFLNDKNVTAGYGGQVGAKKDGSFNAGGGAQVVIKDLNIGGGGGITKGTPPNTTDDGSNYYSPYVPPKAPLTATP